MGLIENRDDDGNFDPIESLCQSRLCAGLPLEEIRALGAQVSPLHLSGGEILVDEDDLFETLHVIARGEVSFLIRANTAAKFTETTRLGVGQFFGESTFLGNEPGALALPPRRSRVIARSDSLILRIDPSALSELLDRHPRLIVRNFLCHSAEKNRLGSRVVLEERLESESIRVFQDLARWFTRSVEESATTLGLTADYLANANLPGHVVPAVSDLLVAARELSTTLSTLGQLAGGSATAPPLEPFSTRAWWESREAQLRDRLAEQRIELDAYVEDCTLTSCPELLASAVTEMFDSLGSLLGSNRQLRFRVGRQFGSVEFQVNLSAPGLTEYSANRLFRPFTVSDEATPFGLSLVRRNARHLGGDATMRRRSGDQLTIVLSLPLHPRNEN